MRKLTLKKSLKKNQLIDIVDALDCLIMAYVNHEHNLLSKEAKVAHLQIAKLLRKDVYKATIRPI